MSSRLCLYLSQVSLDPILCLSSSENRLRSADGSVEPGLTTSVAYCVGAHKLDRKPISTQHIVSSLNITSYWSSP